MAVVGCKCGRRAFRSGWRVVRTRSEEVEEDKRVRRVERTWRRRWFVSSGELDWTVVVVRSVEGGECMVG